MTQMLDQFGVGQLAGSPLRYALAVALRSLPRFLFRRLPQAEVVNTGGPAYQIGLDGEPDPTPLPPGTVLYRGPVRLWVQRRYLVMDLGCEFSPLRICAGTSFMCGVRMPRRLRPCTICGRCCGGTIGARRCGISSVTLWRFAWRSHPPCRSAGTCFWRGRRRCGLSLQSSLLK